MPTCLKPRFDVVKPSSDDKVLFDKHAVRQHIAFAVCLGRVYWHPRLLSNGSAFTYLQLLQHSDIRLRSVAHYLGVVHQVRTKFVKLMPN
jgi:hypothetical protein